MSAEYQKALEHAVLFDLSDRGKVELSGPDAPQFLHNLCTNEILKLKVDEGCEAFLTTGQAKIVAHVLVYRLRRDEREVFWLGAPPGLVEKVVKHLDRHLISEQVELADRTRDFAQLHLAGPLAKAALDQAFHETVLDLQSLQGSRLLFEGKIPIQIHRHEPLGLPGYDLFCQANEAAAIRQTLAASGAEPASNETYQVLRIEAGTPIYGTDIDESNLPQEVGRTEQTVSFTKGCYIGQETVARIRTYGHVNRLLMGLKVAGQIPAPVGAKLFRNNQEVGQVTSSVVSPRLGALALAYVRRGSQEPGTQVQVESEGGRLTAEVASLPFTGSAG